MTENAAKRRIGDILLELGFVSEEALAKAAAEQDLTGQPLGQILVDHGVITRLELASALAEQWSEQASITPLPLPTAPPRVAPPPQPHDDDQYAARLQEAVAELAQKVGATASEEGVDGLVTELAERVEATVARSQRLEATVATLAQSLEGVTGGVEEAFGVLQSGMAGLALDLARLDASIAELRAEPPAGAAAGAELEQQVEELKLAVEALAARPPVDDDARARADELAARLVTLADTAALDSVRGTLAEIERRVAELGADGALAAELEAQRDLLGGLRTALTGLQERPAGDPDLDARLARIEAHLAERLAATPDVATVDALARRVESTAAEQERLARGLDEIVARLDEVARREIPDSEATPIGALEERLAELAAGLEDVRRSAAAEPTQDAMPRLEGLDAALAALEQRLDGGYVTRDDLSHALARARDELWPAPAEPDPRIDDLAERLDDERRLHTVLTAKLDELESRLGTGIVTPDELAAAFERWRDEVLPPTPAAPDPRADQMAHELDRLRGEIARVATAPSPQPDARVDRLADELTALREGLSRVERSGRERQPTVTPDDLADALGRLSERLDALEAQPAAGGVTPHDVEQAVSAARAELAAAVPPPADTSGLEHAVAELADRLARLDGLAERVDGLAETLAAVGTPAPSAAASSPDDLRGEIETRIAELGRRLEERLATAPPPSAGQTVGSDQAVEDELERTRMAIERLGMHLGEHDRALTELLRTRGVTQRLDELAARVDELAAAGQGSAPAGSRRDRDGDQEMVEGSVDVHTLAMRLERIETASKDDREKLMNRLERMASSIDWRLQRLEAGEE